MKNGNHNKNSRTTCDGDRQRWPGGVTKKVQQKVQRKKQRKTHEESKKIVTVISTKRSYFSWQSSRGKLRRRLLRLIFRHFRRRAQGGIPALKYLLLAHYQHHFPPRFLCLFPEKTRKKKTENAVDVAAFFMKLLRLWKWGRPKCRYVGGTKL